MARRTGTRDARVVASRMVRMGRPLSWVGANPAGFFHAMEGRIERALLDAEHFSRYILDGGHNGVAMEARAAGENLQNQQIH